MSAAINMISELKPYKSNWRIQAKILRLWKQESPYGATLELILSDSMGNKIRATIKKQFWKQFEDSLSEGDTKLIRNFAVGQTVGAYRTTDHTYKISFTQMTTVDKCDQLPATLTSWRFANYDDIIDGKKGIEFLFDVIGEIANATNIQTFEKQGVETHKLIVVLRNAENRHLSCTLFGSYAETVNDYVKNQNNINVVLVAQFCRASLWKDVWSVSNAFNCTKVFLNSPHPEVEAFRASLPKDGLALAIVDSKELSFCSCPTEEYFIDNPPKSLVEIRDSEERGRMIALCEITFVVSDMGWFYIACRTCQKKVVPVEKEEEDEIRTVFFCPKCSKDVKDVVPRFMLHLRVKDNTGEATFILFDKDAMQISDPSVLPPVLTYLAGQKYFFVVNVERANVVWKHDSFKGLRIARTRTMHQVYQAMSQTTNHAGSSQGGNSVNQEPLLITHSEKEAEATPSSKCKLIEVKSDDEKTDEGQILQISPSSVSKEIEFVDGETALKGKEAGYAPDQNSASKKVCLASIKKERI